MRNLYWVAIAIFSLIFSACTKIESTTIGSGLIPSVDGVNTLDTTFEVVTNSYINPAADSAKVNRYDDQIIGVINNDPLFGKTTASSFFELAPTSYKYYFPGAISTANVDSAVLILSYRGTFGDTNTNAISQTWEVRELTEKIRIDTSYSTSKSFTTGSILGTKIIDPKRLADSVNYGFEKASNQIRIKLSAAFANRLIKQYDSLPGHAYESDSLFKVNFKGFAVLPAVGSSGNALIRINLLDTNTKLALFYNIKAHPDSVRRDTMVSYFRFRTSVESYSGSANNIKHEYSSSQLAGYFNNTNRNDSLVFIQTNPGTFTTIKIPGLRNFPNAIIHRAELSTLQVTEASGLQATFPPPRFLLLSSYDSSSRIKVNVPNDFIISSGNINVNQFGGYPVDKNVAGVGIVKAYTFDLSRYVQGVVTRKDSSLTFRLSAPSNDSIRYRDPYPSTATGITYLISTGGANHTATGRVRLGGGGMSVTNPLRMRLRIIYSKL